MPENAYVKVVTRCAKHNHVFEIYSSYEAPNGELVFDLVPCPFCFSQKEMVEKPDSISILEEWTAEELAAIKKAAQQLRAPDVGQAGQ